jgi:esterase/lipase superfamily enzyme
MKKSPLFRIVFLQLALSVLFWSGCQAKQEAESVPRTAQADRQSPVESSARHPDAAKDRVASPALPPEHPPVVVKSPKLLVPEAAPVIENSADAPPNVDPLLMGLKSAKKETASTAMPDTANSGFDGDPLIRFDDVPNPLRNDPPAAASSDELREALDVAKKNEEDNLGMRAMARAMPVPSPDMASAGEATPETESPQAATPMAASMGGANYSVVKVFYGTDRAAMSSVEVKNDLIRVYTMWAIIAGCWTFIFALLAFKFLRWRPIKAMYLLSFAATVVFGAMAGFAAFSDRLPNRPTADKSISVAYGDQRGTLELGVCEVTIPKDHEEGELESPSIFRMEIGEDPAKHVVLMKVSPEMPGEFYAQLREGVAQSKENSALVFIHGYNVTFEDAARRTAQIAYDLKFQGVPLFYSWPSQGQLLDYAVDETNAAWTVSHLRQFLDDVARQSGAKQIHLIAHSMGNRALTGALKELASRRTDGDRPAFDQVLLTAPDIDADVFKNEIAPAITKTAQRVTLYASSTDAALLLSKKLHGYPRAGEAGGDIVIVPGMDTVDVTSVDTSLLGHSYYGDSGSVLSDFVEVLRDAKPADQRTWLRPEYLGDNKYWVFQR